MKKGDLRRSQILDAAEKLFFERGYDHTGIQDILNALGLSKGGFYHYFDAKETVLREICERRWVDRYERIRMELLSSRRSPMDRLNRLLAQASIFEAEEPPFAALLLKLCYRDGDASIRDYRRRVLIERLMPQVDEALREGIEAGVLHTRYPAGMGRVLLLLACDVNDECCGILAGDLENPDRMIRVIELLNTYRESVELLCGAPYGSVQLFDVDRMVGTWREATEELNRLEENQT